MNYIEENEKRKKKIFAHYNPVSGKGSYSIPRTRVQITGCPIPSMYLPNDMLKEPFLQTLVREGFNGFIQRVSRVVTEESRALVWENFCQLRIKYDFEFWAVCCVTISGKGLGKDIPFCLNNPQRKYLTQLEELRLAGRPIDIILCKARQWGGSTLTQLYMLWIQLVHKQNWNSVICGDVEKQSLIVRGMLSKAISSMPLWATKEAITFNPYQGSQSTRVINISNSRVSIGSAQKPENIRSEDVSMAHCTEVGLWKATASKKPEDLVQSIFGSIASAPYTMKVLESTAKGVGNYFHRTWIDAVAGKNNFTPVFIAWFDIEQYRKPIKDYNAFVASLTEHEEWLFSLGATLEAINWYRDKKKEITEEWRLASEFPSTADEAFQSTGRRIFPKTYTKLAAATVCEAWWSGDIVNRGDKVQFEKVTTTYPLKVWLMPDTEEHFTNRYVVAVDVGGVGINSDYSCIVVADRLAMIDGGVPEIVACWHGHIEHDKLAWKAVEIARAYDNALLVIEANTLETEGTEGNNFEYILNEVAGKYSNLYCRTSEIDIRKGRPRKWGFHTNPSTKPMVINFLLKALRDSLYIERCQETIFELDLYELKDNGREMGAVEGNHDDRVMATAILIWVCYNTALPVKREFHKSHNPRIVSEASI